MTASLKYRSIARTLTVLLLCLWTFADVRATHIAGAEISYKHISNNTYKFTLKVYRDCRECKFNNIGGGDVNTSCNEVPALQIRGAFGSLYAGTNIGNIEISRTGIFDLTNTCNNTVSKCRTGSNSSYGYEMHVFEGTYDFTTALSNGYCHLDVSIGMSSRNININNQFTEQNFFNFCSINMCEGLPNSSTEFTASPQFLYQMNQSNFSSLGVLNSDGDSLAFSLKPALRNRTVSVSYANGYDFDHPFNFYCTGAYPCSPNLTGSLVEGFFCSKSTGDIAFTPITINQGGVVVVECEEWKRKSNGTYYLAGVTRRDVYSDVVAQNNNLPKIKNRILEYNVCEGQDLKIDLDIEDMPFMLNADSVFAEHYSTLRNSTLLRLNKNTVPYASFTLFTGNTINQVGRHYITVKVWDNNCPVRGTASVTFVVNVRKARTNTVLTQVKNCGVLDVSSTTLNTNIFWEIYDSRFTVIKQQLSRKISTQLPSGGKYYIKSYLPAQNGYCELNQLDSVVVPNFTKPEINMGADRTVCNGVELELSPRLFNTYKEYELFVNGELKSFPYKIQVNEAKSLMFRVIQKDGCFAEDNIQINVFPRLAYKVYDDTFCVNATFPASLSQIQVDRNRIFAVNMTTKDNQIALSPLNAIDWQLDVMAPSKGQHQVNVLIQDRNYCNYKDSFKVHIVEPEPINFNLPVAVCVNTEPIELPVRNNGFWTCLNNAGLVQNNILTIDKTDKSDIQLLYTEKVQCLNTRTYTIRVMDTSEITFGHDQKLKICQSQSPFALRAFPGGGNWYGNYMLPGGTFDAYSAAGKTTELTYRYSNLNDCISSAGVSIEVEKLPELNIEKSKDRICVGDILNLVAASNVLAPGYWQTDGSGSFDNLNNAQVSYTPVPGDVNKPYLTFTYTMQTSGVCGLVPSETIVVVKSGQIGEILKDYPTELCEPAVFNFKSTYQKLEKQYWMVNDSIYEEFDYNFNFNVTLPAGDYVVKTLVNDSTCQAMAMSQNITVWPKPNVQLISNPGSRMSREYPRLYLKDLSYCKYGHQTNWYINNNWIGDSRELNYKVEETRDTFTIKLVAVSNKGGCADSSSQMFVFIPINQLYIPNAFSPDSKGPNENNVFKVVGPPMKYFKIEIFNRYGEKVYMSNDMNATWDGTYKNQLCIQGDYFYKIETTDTEGVSRDYSGTVTVIR